MGGQSKIECNVNEFNVMQKQKGRLHMGMKTKGVSFNEENPTEKELLEKALSYPNFSGKVKEWIKADIENARRSQRTNSGGIRIRVGD